MTDEKRTQPASTRCDCVVCGLPTIGDPGTVPCCTECFPRYVRERLEAAARGRPDPYPDNGETEHE